MPSPRRGIAGKPPTLGSMEAMLNLSPEEIRVLGALIEKEITTPEYYPLSLNALVNAANQKNNREPVMSLSEADVRSALFDLEKLELIRVVNETRATKFEHLAYKKLNLRRPEIALLGLLLLRGPQTAAELRSRAERMYSFDDTQAATETLDRLAGREQPLVVQLGRQPGARESRWMHLLSGPVEAGTTATQAALDDEAGAEELAGRVQSLENLVRALEARIAALEAGSGSEPSPDSEAS